MGGQGSGEYTRWEKSKRPKAFQSLRLYANYLQKEEYFSLSPRVRWSVNWAKGGKPSGNVGGVTLSENEIVLFYGYQQGDKKSENIEQSIKVVWTSCHFGGRRAWFVCQCGKRVGVLFFGLRHCRFRCRQCSGVRYDSQSESERERLQRKMGEIRWRLGAGRNLLTSFPDKPKRMRWETYFRMMETYEEMAKIEEELAVSEFEKMNVSLEKFLERLQA